MARKTTQAVAASDTALATGTVPTNENPAASGETDTNRKRQITYEWNAETTTLTQFRNKQPVQTFNMSTLNEDIMGRLQVHGLRQKLADSHAGKIPEAEALAKEVWDNLVDGTWYAARGEGGERTSLFLEAYVRVMNGRGNPITLDEFRKRVNDIESGDDDDKKKTLRGVRDNPEIVKTMNTIREERAASRRGDATVELDALL